MRQQITEQEQELKSGATPQEDAFAWYIAQGKTNSDAFRATHDCEHWKPTSIHCEASKFRGRPNVLQRISEYQRNIGEAKFLTLEQDIAEMQRLRELCIAKGNLGAAVLAQEKIGKLCGHYTEKLEVNETVDIRTELQEIAKISPEMAEEYAKKKGIPYVH